MHRRRHGCSHATKVFHPLLVFLGADDLGRGFGALQGVLDVCGGHLAQSGETAWIDAAVVWVAHLWVQFGVAFVYVLLLQVLDLGHEAAERLHGGLFAHEFDVAATVAVKLVGDGREIHVLRGATTAGLDTVGVPRALW